MKKCSKCKIEKSLTEFHREGKRGHHSYCKACYNGIYRGSRKRKVDPAIRHRHNLHTRYRITPADVKAATERQQHKCAICEKPLDRYVVDHDHATGKVRGILCRGCNPMIAILDNQPLLAAALRYLGRSL